jgi:hypothetical protein
MAEAQAMEMRTIGEADAARTRMMGEAQADRVARVGMAEAVAIEEQVRAYGGPKFQVTQNVMKNFTDAIATSRVDVVPKIVMGGSGTGAGGGGANGSVMETLLAMLLSDKLGDAAGGVLGDATGKSRNPDLETMRTRIRSEMLSGSPATMNGNGVRPPPLPPAALPKS